MTLEDGAKFVVVAWVKGWSMKMLAAVLGGYPVGHRIDESSIAAVSGRFPFMPSRPEWYFFGAHGSPCRKWIADCYPKLSDALWSASDNAKRLGFAKQIEVLRNSDTKPSSRFTVAEQKERAKNRKDLTVQDASWRLSREAFRSHQRSAWNVCK